MLALNARLAEIKSRTATRLLLGHRLHGKLLALVCVSASTMLTDMEADPHTRASGCQCRCGAVPAVHSLLLQARKQRKPGQCGRREGVICTHRFRSDSAPEAQSEADLGFCSYPPAQRNRTRRAVYAGPLCICTPPACCCSAAAAGRQPACRAQLQKQGLLVASLTLLLPLLLTQQPVSCPVPGAAAAGAVALVLS